jgi:hypothetical protein
MQESNSPVVNTRRRHSAAFKRKILELIEQPGASVAAVAFEHGVNANLTRYMYCSYLPSVLFNPRLEITLSDMSLQVTIGSIDLSRSVSSTDFSNAEEDLPPWGSKNIFLESRGLFDVVNEMLELLFAKNSGQSMALSKS